MFLGNIKSKSQWAKVNLSDSARNVRLEDGGEKLFAELKDFAGRWQPVSTRLSDVSTNDDGVLEAQVPVVVQYQQDEADIVVDKILKQLRKKKDLVVTMVNISDQQAKSFVIHPSNESIKGPDDIGSRPVITAYEPETVAQLIRQFEAVNISFNREDWTAPTPADQFQGIVKVTRPTELTASNSTIDHEIEATASQPDCLVWQSDLEADRVKSSIIVANAPGLFDQCDADRHGLFAAPRLDR